MVPHCLKNEHVWTVLDSWYVLNDFQIFASWNLRIRWCHQCLCFLCTWTHSITYFINAWVLFLKNEHVWVVLDSCYVLKYVQVFAWWNVPIRWCCVVFCLGMWAPYNNYVRNTLVLLCEEWECLNWSRLLLCWKIFKLEWLICFYAQQQTIITIL